jgi:type I restriction enzyme R subunit
LVRAVVVSPGQNEVEFAREGASTSCPPQADGQTARAGERFRTPRTTRSDGLRDRDVDDEADVPAFRRSISTNRCAATLMQTIARANRVFGEKSNRLIVGYIGIASGIWSRRWRSATPARAARRGAGELPVQRKEGAGRKLAETIAELDVRCGRGDGQIIRTATGFAQVAKA